MQTRRILVTGGAGFIGSNLIRLLLRETEATIVNVDKLCYAGSAATIDDIQQSPKHRFEQMDIGAVREIGKLIEDVKPDAMFHLAAESHVDRSIDSPDPFIQTNIMGTYVLLETARRYWRKLSQLNQQRFRFIHVSTDEVFGSLEQEQQPFTEVNPYCPSSPYSASKAAADHLSRAWCHTYKLPVIITNCSNNYGPFQYPEKFIPLMITRAIQGRELPLYGDGRNIRDWIFVEDHARALCKVLRRGRVGERYNVGGQSEKTNMEVVYMICGILDEIAPHNAPHKRLIRFVEDRPGHDYRYALNIGKISSELGWHPVEAFASGLRKTVQWYLDNDRWCRDVIGDYYQGQRLGLSC